MEGPAASFCLRALYFREGGNMADPFDHDRRRLLARIGLASVAAYVAPALTAIGTARASPGSGPSGGGSDGGSAPSGRGGDDRPAPAGPREAGRRPAPPPELVLLLPEAMADTALSGAGYPVLQQTALAGFRLYRLGLPPNRGTADALAELAALFPGAPSDINSLYTPDALLCEDGECGAQAMIGWSGWPGSMAPRIGMIDTGINTDHDALAGQNLHVRQADLGGREVAGRQHGTAVAALLIGRAGSRAPGLLPLAELHAVEAFHQQSGQEAADAYSLAEAIDHLVAAGVSVINMSFSGPENRVLGALVRRATDAGVGLVAAAGNAGPGAPPAYPAAWSEVIAVTAVDAALEPYRQANRGAYVTLAAPGVNLWTAASISGGRLKSGTSYAAPFVTAVLAVERARAPGLDLAVHRERLIACARDLGDAGHDHTFGHGLVSAPNQCLATSAPDVLPNFFTSGE